MEREKFYFASANTGKGFVCHFEDINDQTKPYFQFIIKGGSGTGKSTVMKKVAKHFYNQGFNIEYFYCSSDPASLDGIRIVEKNISIIDGTAPHVFDATLPGVENKIFDTGQYIKSDIRKYRLQILKNQRQKSEGFKNAYMCLSSAKILHDINIRTFGIEIDNSKVKKISNKIIKNLPLKKKKDFQSTRHLFLQALSTDEVVDLTEKNNYEKIIQFECFPFEVQSIFKDLVCYLEANNQKIKVFYEILSPEEIFAVEVDNILIKSKKLDYFNKKIQKNNILIKKIIKNAQNYFSDAKKNHKKIENIFIKNMDFVGLDLATQTLIEEIEKM